MDHTFTSGIEALLWAEFEFLLRIITACEKMFQEARTYVRKEQERLNETRKEKLFKEIHLKFPITYSRIDIKKIRFLSS